MSVRLETLFGLCDKAKTTVDVGCDHGYVGCDLLKSKTTDFLIATDISALSLKKAQDLICKNNLEKFASFRVGDGLNVVKNNESVDQVIIAGMGGKQIARIIDEYQNSKNVKTFVLQPMNELVYLRDFLNKNNFEIIKDFILYDDKFYHFLKVKCGKQKITELEKSFGVNLLENLNADYVKWFEIKCKKIYKIIENLRKNNVKNEQFDKCLFKIDEIKQLIKENKKC